MKLLVLALIDTDDSQLLRKMNTRYAALRRHLPHTRCHVIGDGKPEQMNGYDFTYIHATDLEDKIACCYNLTETLRPDLVYLDYPGASEPLLRYVSAFPNIVFEHSVIEENELTGSAKEQELALGPQIISAAAGVVGASNEIAAYERGRSRSDMPIFVLPSGQQLSPHSDDAQRTVESQSEALIGFLRSIAAAVSAKLTPPPPAPMFSIVIPCYNQAHFLSEAVASVHAQNFPELEVIILNDGSQDNTSDVARQLTAAYPDMAVHLIEQENMGLSEARNSAIRTARAPWIVCLDSDDKLAEGFLRAAAAAIDETPQISALSGMLREFGARDSAWRYPRYIKSSLPAINGLSASVVFRRSLWETVGGYDPSNPWGIEDWHFWLKSMASGWVPRLLSKPQLWYRIHDKTSMFDQLKEHWDEVQALHHTILGGIYNPATVLAAHTLLLNMSEANLQKIKAKRDRFPNLPMPWFWLGLYHEGRGENDAALSCYLRAQHLDAAAIQHPGGPELQWQIHYRLYGLYLAMNFGKKAQASRNACETLKPELKAPLAEQDRIITLATSASVGAKRVLLMGEFFWPSLGGIETFLEHLGDYLLQKGYEVHVATKAFPGRDSLEHRGIQIHEFPHYMNLQRGLLGGIDDFDCLLHQCGFSHVICLSHIDTWSMYLCAAPHPKPKVIFLPLLQNYKDFIPNQSLAEMVHLIGKADHVCRIMEGSLDRQLLELARIKSHFVPHMVPALESGYQFRKSLGLPPDMPLFLNVANFWPFKNHLGLIKALKALQGDWRLAMIGSPHDVKCLEQVKKAIHGDHRFIMLEQQPREVTAAAIREADTVLLGSWYEGCPLTILEAMSIGTPWLATPECGSVVDQAGGFVTKVESFPLVLPAIINDESVKTALGDLGKRHWEACFSPEAVLPAFIDLLENDGAHMPDLRMPPQLRAESAALWSQVKDHIAYTHGIFL